MFSIELSFLDYALSICNVCIRCLFSFPSDIDLAKPKGGAPGSGFSKPD